MRSARERLGNSLLSWRGPVQSGSRRNKSFCGLAAATWIRCERNAGGSGAGRFQSRTPCEDSFWSEKEESSPPSAKSVETCSTWNIFKVFWCSWWSRLAALFHVEHRCPSQFFEHRSEKYSQACFT